ncbi:MULTISPECIES: hypothetical protein [Anaerovoracaceae]|uniref:hypothetical protein n=1 Tax=Anaerovoracaceae TaxID=543314 RepID=UPI0019D11546|nr:MULTISPECIES: hypothetical protein [Clostridia]WRR94205.1 hypothetical protein U5921_03540 [Sinanaerobacter sp. ZZT-01]
METKPIKLSPKKGGNGYVSSYSVNLGIKEVVACNFLDETGTPLEIEKVIDTEKNQIIIRLRT